MCYNCGCDIIDDDMGRGELAKGGSSLVENDFVKMSKDWNMTTDETKKNVLKLLKKQLGQE